jgi:DNA repair exonuclease SbcCD ATPase subunit
MTRKLDMARSGVYKTEVKKARDSLVAQGLRPSIDAVRAALGHTGSKTTIHRYLKDLEAEDAAGVGTRETISDALQHLVAQLAARLKEEADARIAEGQAAWDQARKQAEAALAAQVAETRTLNDRLQRAETALAAERDAHATTTQTLQAAREQLAASTAREAGLVAQIQGGEAHRQSLEEKHRQAREALDHFRQAVKEQREQELRRHEHQVQGLQVELRRASEHLAGKQQEILQLNRDNVRLTEQGAEKDKALSALQQQCDHAMARANEAADLKREVDAFGLRWIKANAELEHLREELNRRETEWNADRAHWHQEREAYARRDQRLEAIEARLAGLATPPAPIEEIESRHPPRDSGASTTAAGQSPAARRRRR